jgi:hypothetical protein
MQNCSLTRIEVKMDVNNCFEKRYFCSAKCSKAEGCLDSSVTAKERMLSLPQSRQVIALVDFSTNRSCSSFVREIVVVSE